MLCCSAAYNWGTLAPGFVPAAVGKVVPDAVGAVVEMGAESDWNSFVSRAVCVVRFVRSSVRGAVDDAEEEEEAEGGAGGWIVIVLLQPSVSSAFAGAACTSLR